MAAGDYSFVIEQGAKLCLEFAWLNADGTPLDITGYKFHMMARFKYDDEEPIINVSSLDPPGGITIVDGPAGKFRIDLSDTETAALNFTEAIYDLEAVPPNDGTIRLFQGKIMLSREVTW